MSHTDNEDEIFLGVGHCFCHEPESGMGLEYSRKSRRLFGTEFLWGRKKKRISDLRVQSKLAKWEERIQVFPVIWLLKNCILLIYLVKQLGGWLILRRQYMHMVSLLIFNSAKEGTLRNKLLP